MSTGAPPGPATVSLRINGQEHVAAADATLLQVIRAAGLQVRAAELAAQLAAAQAAAAEVESLRAQVEEVQDRAQEAASLRARLAEGGALAVAQAEVEELRKQVPEGTPKPPDELLAPGSLVFTPPDHAVDLRDMSAWWTWTIGANWRHPQGPRSSIEGKDGLR